MISTIENFITLLLDELDTVKHDRLYLKPGENPYYMMGPSVIKVGKGTVDAGELKEDMEALGMKLVERGEYYYRHILPDENVHNLRMKVVSFQSKNGEYWVVFYNLLDSQVARPSPGNKFQPSPTPPSNADIKLGFLAEDK